MEVKQPLGWSQIVSKRALIHTCYTGEGRSGCKKAAPIASGGIIDLSSSCYSARMCHILTPGRPVNSRDLARTQTVEPRIILVY